MTVRIGRRGRVSKLLRTFSLAVAVATGILASDAPAQQMFQDRNPVANNFRPTLSPYLSLLNRRTSVLPNYFEFVRPQQQVISEFQRQNREIQRQQQNLQSVDRRIDSMSRPGGATPTGVRGGYMNYSHFYPSLGGR